MDVARRYRWIYKPLVFLACAVPLLLLIAGAFGIGGGVAGTDLGADPVREIIHRTGKTAINLLLITLAITPLRRLTGYPHVLRLRRMVGVFAFAYALLHFCAYLLLDLRLDFGHLGADIAKRPYITVGLAALLILLPLAITSTNAMVRRLGARRWQRLHRAVYVAAILAVVHFYWQVKTKSGVPLPLYYSLALALLLGARVVVRLRQRAAQA